MSRARRDWNRILRASKIPDARFEEMSEWDGHVQYDSTETIRYWRERGYGPSY